MVVDYQTFVNVFIQLILVAFPLALTIGLSEKLITMFLDFVFGRNLKL